jgi:hypothetical protein
LTFRGVVQLHQNGHGEGPIVAIMSVKGIIYTIQAMGEGSQTYEVTTIY